LEINYVNPAFRKLWMKYPLFYPCVEQPVDFPLIAIGNSPQSDL
jgi:hypothetical protein